MGISLVHEIPRSAREFAYTLTKCHSSAPVMLDRGHEDDGCLVQACLTASRATAHWVGEFVDEHAESSAERHATDRGPRPTPGATLLSRWGASAVRLRGMVAVVGFAVESRTHG